MAQSEAPVRAAVFDIGATLVTGPPVAPNKVIASLMNGATAVEVASVIMTSPLECAGAVCAALEQRFGKLEARAVDGIAQLWEAQAAAASEIEGAADVVSSLRARGLKIGLLSDIWTPYYRSVEKALPNVIGTADAIVLSCNTGVRKPHADNFERVLDQLHVKREEAVMIGDTYTHDILPALRLGMRAVWVLARPEREAESVISVLNGESPAPTKTVAHIREVAALGIWPETVAAR